MMLRVKFAAYLMMFRAKIASNKMRICWELKDLVPSQALKKIGKDAVLKGGGG